MIGFRLGKLSQWIKYVWQRSFGHLVYINSYQRDQFMLHLHFLFVRLKMKRALEKEKLML